MILTRRVRTLLFLGLAVANEVVWRTMSDRNLGLLQNLRPTRAASCSGFS